MSRAVRTLLILCCTYIGWCGPASAAPAPLLPDVPTNKNWDVDGTSATYTGGGGAAAPIEIVLDKAVVAGRTLTIQSDGDYVTIGDATAGPVHVGFARGRTNRAASTDGTTTTLILGGGEHPSIAFDGHDSVAETGYWRRLAKSPGATVTLQLTNATFAVVKFSPRPDAAPPTPPPAAAAPAPTVTAGHAAAVLKVKPLRLQQATQAFADSVAKPCPTCNGTGTVTRSVQVGTRHDGGAFAWPVMQNVQQRCPTCLGTQVVHATGPVVLHQAGELMRDLIAVNLDDPTAQDTLKATYDVVTRNAVGDHRCWDVLTKDARATLSVAQPRVGTPLIAEVIVDDATTDAAGRRTFRAHLPGTTNQFVVDDPPSADNVAEGPVLMGGLIDHMIPAREAGHTGTTVIRGAFVISPDIDRRWTWWLSH